MKEEDLQLNRRGDGGTYLVIADTTEEFDIALHYACRLATARRGNIAIAHIKDVHEFIHWGKVEAIIRQDMRKEAEQEIFEISKNINETHGIIPSIYIREGSKIDQIVDIIKEEKNITALVLSASKNSNNPGPLVSYFSGKGMHRLHCPIIIVPGHLDIAAINLIT